MCNSRRSSPVNANNALIQFTVIFRKYYQQWLVPSEMSNHVCKFLWILLENREHFEVDNLKEIFGN